MPNAGPSRVAVWAALPTAPAGGSHFGDATMARAAAGVDARRMSRRSGWRHGPSGDARVHRCPSSTAAASTVSARPSPSQRVQ